MPITKNAIEEMTLTINAIDQSAVDQMTFDQMSWILLEAWPSKKTFPAVPSSINPSKNREFLTKKILNIL